MRYIRRYFLILEQGRKILESMVPYAKKGDGDYDDALLIYSAAFRQLVSSGIPCERKNGNIIIKTDGEEYALPEGMLVPSARNTGKEAAGEEQFIRGTAREENNRFSMEKPEEKGPSGSAPKEETGGRKKKRGKKLLPAPDPQGKDTDDTPAPREESGGSEKEEKETSPSEEPAEQPEAAAESVPFPDHMHKDDFTFCFFVLKITGEGREKVSAQVIMMPLMTGTESPRILACVIAGRTSRTFVSDRDDNKITADIGGYPVTLSGWFEEDGLFSGTCAIPPDTADKGAEIAVKRRHFGKKGHIFLEKKEDNLAVHILPATFRNNRDGLADFIYYAEADGKEITGDTSRNKKPRFDLEGGAFELICRWSGEGIMYSAVNEIRE